MRFPKMSAIHGTVFQKKGASKSNIIKGTKLSLHNSQLLISSGIPAFDALIGGGIPIGSLVLINEDEYGGYAKFVLKYFLAEGVVSNHGIFVCSEDIEPQKLVKELPDPVDAEIEEESENDSDSKKMTIAWRYENLKNVLFSLSGHKHFGHYFDLSKSMDERFIQKADVTYWTNKDETTGESFIDSSYWLLMQSIKEKLEEGKYFIDQCQSDRNILRIVLHRLGSPLWNYDCEDSSANSLYFLKFIYSLRALMRSAYASCIITVPSNYCKKKDIDKCIHLSDIAFQLQSFIGTKYEKAPFYKDYHGFFIIQKLAAINSMVSYIPQTTNLAFKLRKKKLVIDEFSLPPELEDSVEREEDDSSILACASFHTGKYDF